MPKFTIVLISMEKATSSSHNVISELKIVSRLKIFCENWSMICGYSVLIHISFSSKIYVVNQHNHDIPLFHTAIFYLQALWPDPHTANPLCKFMLVRLVKLYSY